MERVPLGWFDPQRRVPRRDERVRIRRLTGIEHLATFTVHHTLDWPAGASWDLDRSDAGLPFYEVVAWRPYDPVRDATPTPAPTPAPTGGVRPLPIPALGVELVQEVALTRLALDALPDGDGALDWQPTPTMPTLGGLAADAVALVGRMATILEEDAVDASAEEAEPPATSKEAVLAQFARHAERVLAAVPKTNADRLRSAWVLYRDGAPVFSRPRGDVLRRLAVSPLVHFRGQLVLLLRRYGTDVPPFYAPWALPVVIPPLPPGEEDAPAEENAGEASGEETGGWGVEPADSADATGGEGGGDGGDGGPALRVVRSCHSCAPCDTPIAPLTGVSLSPSQVRGTAL